MGIGNRHRSKAAILWIQIAVIAFWAVTVLLLLKRSYFSDEASMAAVEPEKVFEMFFAWAEGAEFAILKDGRRIGQMSLSGQVGKAASAAGGGELREISLAGSLDADGVGGGQASAVGKRSEGTYWRGLVAVADGLTFPSGEFVLRMPQAGLGAQLAFDQPAGTISVNLRSGGEELFHYQGSAKGLADLPELGWVGQWLPLEALLGGGGLPGGAMKAWVPGIAGRYGAAKVAGRRMMVYQLVVKSGRAGSKPEGETKLYLSETGEPLMITTPWGYEALAEVLAPIEMYEGGDAEPAAD